MIFRFNDDVRIAQVFRKSGIIEVNPKLWATLDDFQKKFILAHEKGHFDLQTSNELRADVFALNSLKSENRHFKQSIVTLQNLLNINNPKHAERIEKLLGIIELQDYFFYGNQKTKPMSEQEQIDNLMAVYISSLGISNIEQLTEEEKAKFLLNFYQLPAVAELIKIQIANELTGNNFDGMPAEEKNQFLGGIISAVSSIGQKGSGMNSIFGSINDKLGGIIAQGAGALGIKNPQIISGLQTALNPGQLLTGGKAGTADRLTDAQINKGTQALQLQQIEAAKNDLANQQMGGGQYAQLLATQQSVQQAGTGTKTNDVAGTAGTSKEDDDKKKKTKMMIIGGIVLGVIVVGVVIFFVVKSLKK